MDAHTLRAAFEQRFGRPAVALGRAPGRVNLIGEHTDYNDGFVLPMALEHATWVAAAPRDDAQARVVSLQLDDDQTWLIDEWSKDAQPHWTSYIGGVAAILRRQGVAVPGFDALVHSDVPVGSGLSSSAALEVATATALTALAGAQLEPQQLADVARQAEHEYAGVPCGIMDQYISVLGREGTALLLDCRSRAYEHIPVKLDGHVVLIVNSGVKHELAGGEYAQRQRQCQEAVAYFKQLDPAVTALRDVTPAQIAEHFDRLDALVARRARHAVTEDERTTAAAEALRRGDLAEVGRQMGGSHASLRDDYEVSCAELDLLVEIVGAVPGVVGARMTGGGFGGCIVAIAAETSVAPIADALQSEYDARGAAKSTLIQTRPGAGATLIN